MLFYLLLLIPNELNFSQVIGKLDAVSSDTGEEFHNLTMTSQSQNESQKETIQETSQLFTSTESSHSTIGFQKPVRLPLPFVLWWSSVAQSVPKLIRQRYLKDNTNSSQIQNLDHKTTQPPDFPIETNDINEIAAGLDNLVIDSPPSFDQMPSE